MRNNLLLSIIGIFVLSSCNPIATTKIIKSYPPLGKEDKVVVFGLDDDFPEKYEELGKIKIGDSGVTVNCDYYVVLDRAKRAARKMGGNAIKITEHKLPTILGSNCHRIWATVLRI
jgi:hypothetical protein